MEQKVTKFCANFYLCSIRKSPPKNGAKSYQILCKHKIFITWVYMIFKYSTQFRFAPSFNKKDCQYISINYQKIALDMNLINVLINVAPVTVMVARYQLAHSQPLTNRIFYTNKISPNLCRKCIYFMQKCLNQFFHVLVSHQMIRFRWLHLQVIDNVRIVVP